jgi:hypothetical protein
VISGTYASKGGKAIEAELEALRDNVTWESVSQSTTTASNMLTTKWVFTKKPLLDSSMKYKARLVVREFEQQYGIDYKETFAPTSTYQGIRVLMAIAAKMNLKIY